jgi:hypothetical protein
MQTVLESLFFHDEMFHTHSKVLNKMEYYKNCISNLDFDTFEYNTLDLQNILNYDSNDKFEIDPDLKPFTINNKPKEIDMIQNVIDLVQNKNILLIANNIAESLIKNLNETVVETEVKKVETVVETEVKKVESVVETEVKEVETEVKEVETEVKEVETEVKMIEESESEELEEETDIKKRTHKFDKYAIKFDDIFDVKSYFNVFQSDSNILLTYEAGCGTLKNYISDIRCAILNNKNDSTSFGFYIVDIFYPIVFYSGNITRTLKHLYDSNQIIPLHKKYNKRVITIKGLFQLFQYFRKSKKRSDSLMTYMKSLEMIIRSRLEEDDIKKLNNELVKISKIVAKIKQEKTKHNSWFSYFDKLKVYTKKYSSNNQKLTFEKNFTDKQLIKWCIIQKSNKIRGILSSKKIKLLESLNGWHWGIYSSIENPNSKLRWNYFYSKLKLYLEEINHQPFYIDYSLQNSDTKLFKWCISQKSNKNRGLISIDKIEKLDSLKGWHWDRFNNRNNCMSPTDSLSENDSENNSNNSDSE